MSADLHIHVLEGVTEDDVAMMNSNVMGSKHFRWDAPQKPLDLFTKISDTPNVWIGEVSWLKAALFEDPDTFVPDPVDKVSEIVGEDLPVIDEDIIDQITAALRLPNNTRYSIADPGEVRAFLEQHKGKKIFVISW